MPMPQFVLYIATTLDGYIARPDGRIDWLNSFEAGEEDYGYSAFYATIDALIMGATTYEQVLGFGDWVYAGKRSYVLTQRPLTSDRDDIVFVNGGLEAVLKAIHAAGYQRVWIVGGGNVASQFMAQRLIDEYIIAILPIILGDGFALYQSVPEQRLRLIDATSYPTGAVVLRYQQP